MTTTGTAPARTTFQPLVDAAREQGWTVTESGSHITFDAPDGNYGIVTHADFSHRADRYQALALELAGHGLRGVVPFADRLRLALRSIISTFTG